MNDLAILHLSDLHIDGKGNSYSKLHRSLLSDIKTQIASIPDGKLVVVVTGDIINMGEENALENAKKFFARLKEIVDKKIRAIYIVPGNHDKKRNRTNSFLVPAYRGLAKNAQENLFDENFEEKIWPLQMEGYQESGYADLITHVYDDLFEMNEIGAIAKNTFGVHVLEIERKKFCFVLLNTAWSCADDFDVRNLILGKFQLNKIGSQFHELTDDEENVDMTFVMGHHPIECLYGTEQDALFSHMISYTEMSANAYLCGHTHDRTVINWSNNRHAIHTLMTGFGWPEEPSERVHAHYYSIYIFNLDLNSMDIYVRTTDDGSRFIPDLSIYTGRERQDGDKLVRPIRFQEAEGAIALSSAANVPSKIVYASNSFLDYSKFFQAKMCEISLDTGIIIESYKNDLCNNLLPYESTKDRKSLLWEYMNAPEILATLPSEKCDLIKDILQKNQDRICDNFLGFIQRLCQKFHEGLVESINEHQIVRFHFRYLSDKSTSMYSTLCSSFSIFDKNEEQTNQPSDIKYCDLLEAAFVNQSSGCLIYSVNKSVCTNKLKDKWKDFITVVPKFPGNIYKKKVNQNSVKQYPLITFCVTINDSEHAELLRCMDFYAMDQFVGEFLQSYLNVFMLDIESFLGWLKNEEKLEAK